VAPLSAEEQSRANAHRDRAARKLKMARVLGNTGFDDEARPALLEAIHALGSARAVESRLPEPPTVKETVQPPLSHGWSDLGPVLKGFLSDPEKAEWKPLAERLAACIADGK
jgi:hypothetical protein